MPTSLSPVLPRAAALLLGLAALPAAGQPEVQGGVAAVAAQADTPPPDPRAELEELQDAHDLRAFGLEAEEDGDLSLARKAYQRGAEAAGDAATRATLEGERTRLAARIALRREVTLGLAAHRRELARIGVLGVEDRGVQFDGRVEVVPWDALRPRDWEALAGAIEPSSVATLGLAQELYASGARDRADRILADLLDAGAADRAEVDRVVAWARGEDVPLGGYAWKEGTWTRPPDVPVPDVRTRARDLERRLERGRFGALDAEFDALRALGRKDLCRAVLAARWKALEGRWNRHRSRLVLERLAAGHAEVEELQRETLARIEDPVAYPEDVSTPEARLRERESQQYIDAHVKRLGALRDVGSTVRFPRSVAEMAAEGRWLRAREAELGVADGRPDGVPAWLLAILPRTRSLDPIGFACDVDQARLLARDRAVRARNADLWARERRAGRLLPSDEGVELVRVTNDYRTLLGRRALAWSPVLRDAARDHADYMQRTGDFGHSEPEPDRATPQARMTRRGYAVPGGENCYAGPGGARDVHTIWTRSPGHHRNIVKAAHTEVAVVLEGTYWVQDFGGDTTFLKELEAWSD